MTYPARKLNEKSSMSLLPICGEIYEKTEIFFRSKELMDKAILLESKVKP